MKILGDVIPAVESALRFRVARAQTLASNVANADTPGYRRSDLTFQSALDDAAARLVRTDPKHIGASHDANDYRVVRGEPSTRPDRNGVDLDQELIEISRNSAAFTQQTSMLSRLFALQRTAIQGNRR